MKKLLLLLLCVPLIGFGQEKILINQLTNKLQAEAELPMVYLESLPLIKYKGELFTGIAYNNPINKYYDGEKFEANFIDGELNGLYREWCINGKLMTEGNYKNGKQEGLWIYYSFWDNCGFLEYEINYKDGLFHGLKKEFWENGQLKHKGYWSDGKKHGTHKFWYLGGALGREENYKDDKKHGLHKWWKSNGTLLSEEYYDEGKLINGKD